MQAGASICRLFLHLSLMEKALRSAPALGYSPSSCSGDLSGSLVTEVHRRRYIVADMHAQASMHGCRNAVAGMQSQVCSHRYAFAGVQALQLLSCMHYAIAV